MSSNKTSSGFKQVQSQIDRLKFEIDEFCEDDLPNVGTASPGRMSAYKRANQMKHEVDRLKTSLNELTITAGGISTDKKTTEMKRLQKLKVKLMEVIEQLEPDEVEEDYFRKFENRGKGEASKVKTPRNEFGEDDEDEDDLEDLDDEIESGESEDYEDDDEEEDNKNEEEDEDTQVICVVEALMDYVAQEEGDLSFKKNQKIEIIEASDNGWWTGRDQSGNEGLVPSTLVKVIDSEEDEEEDEEEIDVPGKRRPVLEKKRSGKELWDHLKETKPSKTSVTEVLKAMKAIPTGFRSSTLGKWYQRGEYRASSYIIPKVGDSNLQYRDLYWDGVNKKLRPQTSVTCRTFSLVSVKCIPPIGAGVEILSRHVYIALWDEEKILSNIHLVRAVPLEKDLSWTFTPKVSRNIPSLYDGEIVARINSDDRKLSLLIELNYSYVRLSTGERSDICCGWASLPLYDVNGAPVPNKNHDLNVNGGTPFEKGIPLDPTLNLNTSQSLMQSLIRSNRQPRITIKTTTHNKMSKEIYDTLPETLITCQRYSRFIGYYRQHAATVFCKDDIIEKGTVFDPLLTEFPKALDYPDLMDALNMAWEDKTKTQLNRSQRRDNMHMQMMFLQTFNESLVGLMQSAQLPPFRWADEKTEKERFAFILSFLQSKDPAGNLLSPDQIYKPMNISRMAFTNNSPLAHYPHLITREKAVPS